jgi:sugar O-acyltransferase (sialic acid O-acetyltransferase NeuD family)
MKKGIIGAGGFGREIMYQILDCEPNAEIEIFDDFALGFRKTSEIDFNDYEIIVAIGNSTIRKKIVESISDKARFFTFIHKSARLIGNSISIGEGSMVCANTILTCDIQIGKHALINLNCTIGHDCKIGDFFSAQPGVNVSGGCEIGNSVYIGTNTAIREKIKITNDVIIGLNSGVVNDIFESGTYVGCPTKKIK